MIIGVRDLPSEVVAVFFYSSYCNNLKFECTYIQHVLIDCTRYFILLMPI